MMSSKFIGYFLEEVSVWQKKLSAVDMVISIWMEVQRTWSHLESIFIGSEDIRKQLPHDSERFDQIDNDFKVCYNDFKVCNDDLEVCCNDFKMTSRLVTMTPRCVMMT
jgi:dynein heavy chain, axonemal